MTMTLANSARRLFLADALGVPDRLFWKMEDTVKFMWWNNGVFEQSQGYQAIANEHFGGDQGWAKKLAIKRLLASIC